MYRFAILAGVFAMLHPAIASAELPPLIPRDVLFGNPGQSQSANLPQRQVHCLPRTRRQKRTASVGAKRKPPKGEADDKKITSDEKRGIRQYFWGQDNKHLLYLQDKGGDENFHLYASEIETGKTRDLTPFDGVRVQGVDADDKHPDTILVGLNKRKQASLRHAPDHCFHRRGETRYGEPRRRRRRDHRRRLRHPRRDHRQHEDGWLRFESARQSWRGVEGDQELDRTEEQGSAAGFGKEPNVLYIIGNDNANAARLVKYDLSTNKEEVIAEDKEYDLGGMMFNNQKRIPLAVSFTKARTEWKVLDDSVKDDFATSRRYAAATSASAAQPPTNNSGSFAYTTDDGPTSVLPL